ncbi:hypothetical protein MMC30_007397 [Trapelia coarctata]|nr:hypothetical protein [Trapelia coarctata]
MADKPVLDQKPVPKFASFRPKTNQAKSTSSGREGPQNLSNHEESQNAKRHSSSSHQDSSKRRRSRDERVETESSSRNRRQPRGQHGKQESHSLAITSWNDKPELFAIDKFGDESNVKYGSLHRYDIPSYFRAGFGSIIGLSQDQKINREASSEKHVTVTDLRGSLSSKRDRMAFAKLQTGRETRIKPVEPAMELRDDTGPDFLPLSNYKPTFQRENDDEQPPESPASSDDESHHYRSIQGKSKPSNVPEDPDLEYNVSSSRTESNQTSSLTDEITSRKIALARRVDLEPENGEAWLDLIDYQDKIITPHAIRPRLSAAERFSVADIKLSMYQKALDSVQDPMHQESLILGMMEEGSKVWEPRKLASKWRSVLHDNPYYIGLWTKYVDFEQTHFSTFRFDDVRETFTKCLGILRAVARQDDVILEIQVYVLLRFTLCMREAGFLEQSAATWQSMLEFNCLRPAFSDEENTFEVTRKRSLDRFEEFWESEIPRIGEENSQGWTETEASTGELPPPKADEPLSRCNSISLLETWHDQEHMRSLQARQPARTIDNTLEDDPYRVVLFSDIKPFLFPLPSASQRELVHAFLAFCQLPPTENTPVHCLAWWKDSLTRNVRLHGFEVVLKTLRSSNSDSDPGQGPFRHLQMSLNPASSFLGSPVSLYLPSTDLLFARTGVWFSIFDECALAYAENQGLVEVDWMRRVLRVLVDAHTEDDSLGEYLIALECKLAPSTAKKTAKALLRVRPTSLRLYNAYALVECRLGNSTAAESVWSTALSMSKDLGAQIRNETILLWRTWVWELLDSSNPKRAFERLLTLADKEMKPETGGRESSPATILRTQRALIDGRDHALSFGDYRRTVLYCECLTLLEYLANSHSIEAALSCFKIQVTLLSSRLPHSSQAHESLHQSRAKLLYYHTSQTHSFRPGVIRSTLEESIKLFPQNTIFLSLYAWNESRFRIDDRVRSIVHDVVLSSHEGGRSGISESVVSLLFSVYTELTRSTATGSNVHCIRASFERAVENPCGKHSAAMWKLYFLFEHSRGDVQKAKMVFYRAVRACPWVKELYLLPFEYLRGVMPVVEAKGIYQMLVEKELRVFVSLDEVFEDMDD